MKLETRAALQDRQNKVDAYVSKRGQEEARRYLAKNRKSASPITMVTLAAIGYVTAVTLAAYLFG